MSLVLDSRYNLHGYVRYKTEVILLKTKTVTAIYMVFLIIAAGCKTVTPADSTNSTINSTDYSSPRLSETLKPHFTTKDIEKLSATSLSYKVSPEHYLNKLISNRSLKPYGFYIFNGLKIHKELIAGEMFIKKVNLVVRSTVTSDAGFEKATYVPSVYILGPEKANAMRESSNNPRFIRDIDSYNGYFSKTNIGNTNNANVTIEIPVHLQNTNFFILFNGPLEVSKFSIEFMKSYKSAAPYLASQGYKYDKEIQCESKENTGMLGELTKTSTETKCLIGKNKPRQVVLKKRLSKTNCSHTKIIELDKIVDEAERISYYTEKEGSDYYIKVRYGCRGIFGVDTQNIPLPRKSNNTSTFSY